MTFRYCRFLYIIGELRPGGSERQLYYLLKGMDRQRYLPHVVVWNFRQTDTYVSRIQALGVPLHSFPSASSRITKLTLLRDLVAKFKPEVVHSYSFYTNFAAFCATYGTKSFSIGGVRSDFRLARAVAGPLLGRLNARWPRTQIFNSFTAAQSALNSRSLFAPKECWVVRNGLDLELFPFVPQTLNGHANILGIGSLFPVKRWDRLVSSAVALKKKGAKFLIRVVGEGPQRAILEQQARDFRVSDQIKFIGQKDDISALLAEANLLVHTSENEGTPNAVMEAMASGRPVVSTDVGDVRFMVEDGKTGFVVQNGDNATLNERIVTLITNPDLCFQMGRAGRTKAEREFASERMVSATLAAYQSLDGPGI